MGRHYTGAATTDQCMRIELSKLLKSGYFKAGCIISGQLKWTNGGTIAICVDYTAETPILNVRYTLTDKSTGKEYHYNYDIELVKRPSNLGKGEILYFVCPASRQPCRILYKAYGYHKWKCREAYQNRIYYPTQVSSKRQKYNDRYWQLEGIMAKNVKRKTYLYKGKVTKRAIKEAKQFGEYCLMDRLRWSRAVMPKRLLKYLSLV
jgi:hypothetical protein